ncbi:hypothetical protein BJ742DRAFT_662593, partial [Cladochytrium replicatum]
QEINVGDMVLLYNSSLDGQWSRKFETSWMGLYVITEKQSGGTYQIREPDGAEYTELVSGAHLKLFRKRSADLA